MLDLDDLVCWVGSFDLIVIRVQLQHVPGIARYNVFLQGDTYMTGGWGIVIVDAVHEYSSDIFPVAIIVIVFRMD